MPKAIHREEVQQLLREGGQLVEVLPQRQFREIHIAGATNRLLLTAMIISET